MIKDIPDVFYKRLLEAEEDDNSPLRSGLSFRQDLKQDLRDKLVWKPLGYSFLFFIKEGFLSEELKLIRTLWKSFFLAGLGEQLGTVVSLLVNMLLTPLKYTLTITIACLASPIFMLVSACRRQKVLFKLGLALIPMTLVGVLSSIALRTVTCLLLVANLAALPFHCVVTSAQAMFNCFRGKPNDGEMAPEDREEQTQGSMRSDFWGSAEGTSGDHLERMPAAGLTGRLPVLA